MGMTIRGRSRLTASAARSGSRWPSPSVGPQPQMGRRATSSGSREPLEPGEEVGVAREIDRLAASDEKADGRARAAVLRGGRLHRDVPDRALVACVDGLDRSQIAAAAHRPGGRAARDDRRTRYRACGARGHRDGHDGRATGARRRSGRAPCGRVAVAAFVDERPGCAGWGRSGGAFRRDRAAPLHGRPT